MSDSYVQAVIADQKLALKAKVENLAFVVEDLRAGLSDHERTRATCALLAKLVNDLMHETGTCYRK